MGMSRRYVAAPSADMMNKIHQAIDAVASQQQRVLKCPYCRRNAIIVFEDTKGHVQVKCKNCGQEVVFDTVNMRREMPF